jgi:hypothetical protein
VIERNNPLVDVDELMAKIHQQLASQNSPANGSTLEDGRLASDATTLAAGIENSLAAAESFAQVRTTLGSTSRVLSSSLLRSFLLRALAFIFRDQRNVDNALIDALRKTLHLNVRLSEECEFLKSRVAALEGPRSEGPPKSAN